MHAFRRMAMQTEKQATLLGASSPSCPALHAIRGIHSYCGAYIRDNLLVRRARCLKLLWVYDSPISRT